MRPKKIRIEKTLPNSGFYDSPRETRKATAAAQRVLWQLEGNEHS
jgi:hypothetical protein